MTRVKLLHFQTGSHLLIMEKILQYASSQDIYFTPTDEFTAKFIGTSNLH